jgi:hypothetical protein
MTEADWLVADDPLPMLDFLRGKASERKLRLFACACCRAMGGLLGPEGLHALEVAEHFADDEAGARERAVARASVVNAWPVYLACSHNITEAVEGACAAAAEAVGHEAYRACDVPLEQGSAWERAHSTALGQQAELLRHLFRSPMKSLPRLAPLPGPVMQLAEALYAGQEVAFALHDALLDAGQADLSEHFRTPAHPKGCWAVDWLLGKS